MSARENLVVFRRIPKEAGRKGLQVFAWQLQDEVAAGQPFCCLVTTDAELHQLNRKFLEKDAPTDVLSFPAAGPGAGLGDIAISYQRAEEQAARFGHSVEDEIKILMLHGVLHLQGMDHDSDRGAMARTERKWRKKLQLPVALIERARA